MAAKKSRAAAGAATRSAKRATKKPAKMPSQLEANLADARALQVFLAKQVTAAKKAEQKRKKKLLAKSTVDAFKTEIHVAATALNAQNGEKQRAAAASAREVELRAELHARVVRVRNLMQAAYPGNAKIGSAFGQRSRLVKGSTQDAIAVSALQEQSFVDAEYTKSAKDAGLTPADMQKQTALRRALDAADAAHTGAIGARKGQRLDATALGAALKKRTTHLRKSAQVVFADEPKILAQIPARRRTAKRRAKAPASPTPAASPPAAPKPAA
jgi:hypothetical protein